MRILFASHGYPPTLSGVTRVAEKLARAMVVRGHHVTVVTASDRGAPYRRQDDGVCVEHLRSCANPFWKEGRIPLADPKSLREIIRRTKPDIIHTHETAHLAYVLTMLARRDGIPVVATCHYLPHFAAYYVRGSSLVEALVAYGAVRILNRCQHAVFATESHRATFLALGLTAPSSVISNGIAYERYGADETAETLVSARYGLPPHPRVLFVGRLAADKQLDVLIRAMARIDHNPEAHLLLVGRGDRRSHLEATARALDLADRVHLLGYVPEEDMPAIYRAADLFAIAATVETQSLPTLQAMASGLPVVAAKASALPEIVRHGETGLLVPPADDAAMGEAIRSILTNPDMAAEMGKRARALAQQHEETRSFDQYQDLYERVIDKGRR